MLLPSTRVSDEQGASGEGQRTEDHNQREHLADIHVAANVAAGSVSDDKQLTDGRQLGRRAQVDADYGTLSLRASLRPRR